MTTPDHEQGALVDDEPEFRDVAVHGDAWDDPDFRRLFGEEAAEE